MEFLAENHVPVMEWPAQSPDFKARFHKRFLELFSHASKSLEARYRHGEVLQEVWYNQGMEMVEALIKSMPKRCAAVIEANGGWTKW